MTRETLTALRIVLDYVEAQNKFDEHRMVAQAAADIERWMQLPANQEDV